MQHGWIALEGFEIQFDERSQEIALEQERPGRPNIPEKVEKKMTGRVNSKFFLVRNCKQILFSSLMRDLATLLVTSCNAFR